MERFLKIRPGITRCTYTPTDAISEQPMLFNPAMTQGAPVSQAPIPIQNVTFKARSVYRSMPDGKPVIRVLKTVDGQRTYIENLHPVHVRDAWRAHIRLKLDADEHIYGFGQDEDGRWDKHNGIEYIYQHNMRIAMPMFVSSKGYGVLVDAACLMRFEGGETSAELTLECVQQADLYVIQGSMDEIVAGYRELTGRAAPMPDWMLGYVQSKERYADQAELVEVARRYRELNIPLDVVVQDWKTWPGELWGEKHLDKERYPDAAAMKQQMQALHVHTLVSVWPNMNAGGEDHLEFAQRGMLLNDYSTYNAFDPAARTLYWQQAERELWQGFDGWWCDNTEPFPTPDWCGETKLPEKTRYELVGGEHEKYLDPAWANAFALAHAQGIYENQPEEPVVNLTRSGYAGIQKYGVILWAGDTSATWQELKQEIAKGMSISLCGIPYWTVDAGAFFTGGTACWRKWSDNPNAAPVWFWHGDYDGGVNDLGYQELYTRWLQFACFLPVFRSHGTDTPREVWNFTEPFRSAIEKNIHLRYRLMPYIKDMARRVTQEHFTIMRSLLFDFPSDERAALIDDEFMFGNDLLVCPVTEPMYYGPESRKLEHGASVRRCWLPQGVDWYDFWTNERYTGGRFVDMSLTLEHIPLFVRAGTILLVQQDLHYTWENRPVQELRYPE